MFITIFDQYAYRCIMCLVFLVAAGIVTAIAMKILGVGDDGIDLPGPQNDDVRLG